MLPSPKKEKSSHRTPNVIHFIWFGSYPKNLETISKWVGLNPNFTIKIWTSSINMGKTDYKHFVHNFKTIGCEVFDINESPIRLKNLDIIFNELKSGRWWSASDILRFSILSADPGYYFDFDAKAIKSLEGLPTDACECPDGFYVHFPQHILDESAKNFAVDYDCFVARETNQRIFKDANFVIQKKYPVFCQQLEKLLSTDIYKNFEKQFGKKQSNYVISYALTGNIIATLMYNFTIDRKLRTMLHPIFVKEYVSFTPVTDDDHQVLNTAKNQLHSLFSYMDIVTLILCKNIRYQHDPSLTIGNPSGFFHAQSHTTGGYIDHQKSTAKPCSP